MTDLSKRASDAARNVNAPEQSHALRASLAVLLIQTLQAEATIKYRIAELEDEAHRLHEQLGQMTPAIESLRQTIHDVDEVIRRQRNETAAAAATKAKTGPGGAEAPPRQAGREPRARSGRRKASSRIEPGEE
jgi:predicted  nucleic acid-binding Zn-ribbon protein